MLRWEDRTQEKNYINHINHTNHINHINHTNHTNGINHCQLRVFSTEVTALCPLPQHRFSRPTLKRNVHIITNFKVRSKKYHQVSLSDIIVFIE